MIIGREVLVESKQCQTGSDNLWMYLIISVIKWQTEIRKLKLNLVRYSTKYEQVKKNTA